MEPRDFCYWLQGYFELQKIEHGDISISPQAATSIDQHLQTVFDKITPKYNINGFGIGLTPGTTVPSLVC